MLEVSNVQAGYGRHPVLHDVSIEVAEGELIVVLGSNGAGKTTLIRAICGTIPTTSGRIGFLGKNVSALPAHARARLGIATVPQGRGLFPDMSVAENLALGAFRVSDKAEIERRREAVFELFPRLRERLNQAAQTMSGGEQQMLAIGRALMSGPSLLLLDEPSLGLSSKLTIELFRAIRRIADDGMSILLVEQNALQSLEISTRGYLIENGAIIGSGPADALKSDRRVIDAYLGGGAASAPTAEAARYA